MSDYFDRIAEELLDLDELKGSDDELVASLAVAYQRYRELLIEKNCVDFSHQQVFFSKMVYGNAVSFGGVSMESDRAFTNAVAFAGIANPTAFFKQVESLSVITTKVKFSDHHHFQRQELLSMLGDASDQTTFVTTEKDFVRLKSNGLLDLFQNVRACYIPINIQLNDASVFEEMIAEHLQAFGD
jgi:tetraacyldisaccharide-1-P 4'-kinase